MSSSSFKIFVIILYDVKQYFRPIYTSLLKWYEVQMKNCNIV